MKKIASLGLQSLILAGVFVLRASAVWVPPASDEPIRPRPAQEEIDRASLKLVEDEQKLEAVLGEFKRDHRELRRLLGVEKENSLDSGVDQDEKPDRQLP